MTHPRAGWDPDTVLDGPGGYKSQMGKLKAGWVLDAGWIYRALGRSVKIEGGLDGSV